ncbi:TauD/TfdA family dioxygenase [uncultured Tateyamaria sp.]|uniref:TauD/TfdA dioxygenase family protein n=1 Tax=uncultured Tateyamaria sp. TaxID=455651 RepID=UPI002609844D|nr:TauD/TfdA family dioxygenase [uncultured Tateyamaria sp.]
MRTTPLTDRFGVEVHDMDLSTIEDAGYRTLRGLFEEHSVLLLRSQSLDDAARIRLARRFGPIEDRLADERPADEDFAVPQVSNVREDGSLTGEMDLHSLHLKANMLWHADSTFMPTPALTNILTARVVTKTGGATELASTRAGWADMPETLRAQVRDTGFWHRYAHSRARISPELAQLPMFHKWPDQLWRAVWRNPVNGRDALYIASHAFAVHGQDKDTGAALIDRLIEFTTQPQFVYAHQWQVGDVLIWDQRAVLHRGTAWNHNEPRVLSSICISATPEDGVDAMRLIV